MAFWKPTATGRKLTAFEALDAFGHERLLEVLEYGTAVLPPSADEPARTLRRRREQLGLSIDTVARRAGVEKKSVEDAENPNTRTMFREIQRVATALGLDDRLISIEPGAGGDEKLAGRLKTLGAGGSGLSENVVATLAEVAWVIRTEARLRVALQLISGRSGLFEPDSNYGSKEYPAWMHGFYLAGKARTNLNLSAGAPVKPLRSVTLGLGLPLVSAELPEHIAGATISSGGVRGIVVNTAGQNENVWVRRATVAHELGHLLWDPEDKLKSITVDDYSSIQSSWVSSRDRVESRANAFAVEFLAPQREVEKVFRTSSSHELGLRAVMEEFGISFTAARFHIWNACDRTLDVDSLDTSDKSPSPDWRGVESFTVEYFPLKDTPAVRRGPFAGFVVAAERAGVLSDETAASYLGAELRDYLDHASDILDLYSDVVSGASVV